MYINGAVAVACMICLLFTDGTSHTSIEISSTGDREGKVLSEYSLELLILILSEFDKLSSSLNKCTYTSVVMPS